MKENKNIPIRAYIRANPHLTDEILADKFDVSTRSINANRAHITMGTDTDNPQARAKAAIRNIVKGLSLIKTPSYELRINERGQFTKVDLIGKKFIKLTDDEAKQFMLKRIDGL